MMHGQRNIKLKMFAEQESSALPYKRALLPHNY
jgi:hypothetical protein